MGKISVQTVAKAMCTDAINQLTKGAGEEARSVIYENPQIHGIVDEHPKASEKENAGTSQKSKTEEKTSTEDKPETQEQREETKAPETESASETAKTTEEPATGEAVVDEKKE